MQLTINRRALDAVQLPSSTRNDPPYQGEVWRAKLRINRPENLGAEQSGNGFNLKVAIPERLIGKKGVLRTLEDKPEIGLNQWWSNSEFRDYGIPNQYNVWVNGFAPNEMQKTVYVIFQAYPEIADLSELEWEEMDIAVPTS